MRRFISPQNLRLIVNRSVARYLVALVLLPWTALAAYAASPASTIADATAKSPEDSEYRIGPLDILSITVFPVKDLTLEKVQVDADGQIILPLIGLVDAKGRTARELSDQIAAKLDATYLHNAQVSVLVDDAASQRVTVEGAVTEAGVFPLRGRASLLQAIAMAKSTVKTADLKHVAVFRDVGGTRTRLTYDLSAIRAGRTSDPVILGGDTVVVPSSASATLFQDAVTASPMIYLLALFH